MSDMSMSCDMEVSNDVGSVSEAREVLRAWLAGAGLLTVVEGRRQHEHWPVGGTSLEQWADDDVP